MARNLDRDCYLQIRKKRLGPDSRCQNNFLGDDRAGGGGHFVSPRASGYFEKRRTEENFATLALRDFGKGRRGLRRIRVPRLRFVDDRGEKRYIEFGLDPFCFLSVDNCGFYSDPLEHLEIFVEAFLESFICAYQQPGFRETTRLAVYLFRKCLEKSIAQ